MDFDKAVKRVTRKLTGWQVQCILPQLRAGITASKLAKDYNVNKSTISRLAAQYNIPLVRGRQANKNDA